MRKFLIALVAFMILVSPVAVVSAQSGSGGGGGGGGSNVITIPNPLKSGTNTLYDFIKLIINDVILPVGGVIAVLSIIYAGFLLVTAQGDEKQLQQGKRAFVYAAIGSLILLGAWAISLAIQGTVNQLITP